MKIIISTCGTSLLTNGVAQLAAEEQQPMRHMLNAMSNHQEKELSPEEKARLDAYLDRREQDVLRLSLEEARRASAEINGLCALFNGALPQKSDQCYLVQTDTYLGKRCCSMLCRWGEQHNLNISVHPVPDLNTRNLSDFRVAMNDLTHWCAKEIAPQRNRRTSVIFNLTGGFKSVNGFMQTLGMLYADEVVYLFESSHELLRIPRLPLDIESAATAIMERHVHLFRRMSADIPATADQICDIPRTLIDEYDKDQYLLSPWGIMLWEKFTAEYYSRDFIQASPLPDEIIYTQKFLESISACQKNAEELYALNERIDDLLKYYAGGKKDMPKRLTFKKLSKQYKQSTHEFYAWSKPGAKRVFCHYEDSRLVLDMLGNHL